MLLFYDKIINEITQDIKNFYEHPKENKLSISEKLELIRKKIKK